MNEQAFLTPLPKRILMTADPIGGVWTYALELARALEPYGIEIVLVLMGARLTPRQRQEIDGISNVNLAEGDFKLEWMEEPWPDLARAGDWLLELAARLKPDLIHLNGYAHGSLPWPAPVLITAHSCVLSWWRGVRYEDAPANWDKYRAAVRRGIQAAAFVVAPSQAMLSSLRDHYGPLPASEVIPNGRALPERCGAKEDFVLAAGRIWDDAKNLAALTAVASNLPWRVFLAGDAESPNQRTRKMAASGPWEEQTGNVRLLGRLSPAELWQWFSRAAIYALPARYEPFGLSALEAALCGCALVLGDIPSLREIWHDAALFVPSDETETLKRALQELMADRGRLAEWGGRAHARALEFTPERMAAGYLNVYSRLISESCGGLHPSAKEKVLCES